MSDEKVPEFLSGNKETITEDSLGQLKEYVDTMKQVKETMEAEQAILDELSKKYNKLSMELIPELLATYGLSELKLDTGEKIIVKEDVNVTVKDDFLFQKFLRKRGEDDIIKTIFNVGKIESDIYNKILDFLEENDIDFESADTVHGSTKKAYFRNLLGFGKTKAQMSISELPSWANAFVLKKTNIVPPKEKKL